MKLFVTKQRIWSQVRSRPHKYTAYLNALTPNNSSDRFKLTVCEDKTRSITAAVLFTVDSISNTSRAITHMIVNADERITQQIIKQPRSINTFTILTKDGDMTVHTSCKKNMFKVNVTIKE